MKNELDNLIREVEVFLWHIVALELKIYNYCFNSTYQESTNSNHYESA